MVLYPGNTFVVTLEGVAWCVGIWDYIIPGAKVAGKVDSSVCMVPVMAFNGSFLDVGGTAWHLKTNGLRAPYCAYSKTRGEVVKMMC